MIGVPPVEIWTGLEVVSPTSGRYVGLYCGGKLVVGRVATMSGLLISSMTLSPSMKSSSGRFISSMTLSPSMKFSSGRFISSMT